MALTLSNDQPVLLHATTDIACADRLKTAGAATDTPTLFAAGASFHR